MGPLAMVVLFLVQHARAPLIAPLVLIIFTRMARHARLVLLPVKNARLSPTAVLVSMDTF